MTTPAAKAAIENRREHGLSNADSEQPSTHTVDITISGAPDAVKGANGDYSLHQTPLHGQTIPYYQGIAGDAFHMFIIYSENDKRWEITSNMGTLSETKVGVVAYIACDIEAAKTTYLGSISDKKEWYILNSNAGQPATKSETMVAIVKSGSELTASTAAPAASSTAAAVSVPAVSTAAVSVPAAAPVVVTAPTVTEMKTIITDIDKQYTTVSDERKKLTTASPDTDWSNFKKNNLDKATADLKKALAQLDAFKKAGSDSSASTPSKVGGSSASKKNRKSHKSYHPGIGKTRKHHSHSEPKRVSFVHQA
jgi:hypothetical protein